MRNLTWQEEGFSKRRNLPIRDLHMFLPNGKRSRKTMDTLVNIPGHPHLSKQFGLPSIMPRPKAKCYLLDLGSIRLICRKGQADILYCTDGSSSRRHAVNSFVEELNNSLNPINNKTTATGKGNECEPLAFELQVLEAALSCVVQKFQRQLAMVGPVLEALLSETISNPTDITIGRLTSLKKSIFAYTQGVQAKLNAIRELLGNNRDMADMYLDDRVAEDHEEVELLLEAYASDLLEIEMEAMSMTAQIEDTMELIALHLNGQRNRIIRLSLIMEMLALTAGSGAFIGSIFGMNLLSGLEGHPSAFYWTVGGTSVFMGSILAILSLRFRHHVISRPAGIEHNHSGLKHFFSYIDDIEAKVRSSNSISRSEFEAIVASVIGTADIDRKEVDLLFYVLDGNHNNSIEFKELPPPVAMHGNHLQFQPLQADSTPTKKA
jgi:hypothetical protein